ncbi:MAG: HEAT repeat domain-containing protein [Gemmatimonadales bacterium]
MRTLIRMTPFAAAAALGLAAGLGAQGGLRERVERGDGTVQFSYAARSDVCGWGRSINVGNSFYVTTGNVTGFRTDHQATCRRGPVVVRIVRAGGVVVDIDVEVAPETRPDGVTDIGTVSASAAAAYLLDLAGRAEGRPAREAIMPAVLADSVDVSAGLLRLAQNKELARAVRQSALSWLGRELETIDAAAARQISAGVVAIAGDPAETTSIRQSAVSVLARTEQADLAALTRMATGADRWLRQAALQALANSGDPRARDFLRAQLANPDLPENLRVTVVRGIGREYATPRDAELLRTHYASATSLEAKRAILSVIGELGGTANLEWVLRVAADESTPSELRTQAADAAQKAGATTMQLYRLYETAVDRRGKEAATNALFKVGDREATDRLIQIAKTETDPTVRRAVITRLARSDDPRVKELLKQLVEQ